MNNLDLTILGLDQIVGDNQLEIFKKRRRISMAISDYAITSGGFVPYSNCVDSKKILENRKGLYWTKTYSNNDEVCVINDIEYDVCNDIFLRDVGVCLALPFSSISNRCQNKKRTYDGILKVEFGEYLQQAVSIEMQIILEKLYQEKLLTKTEKYYTRDKTSCDDYNQKFQEESQEEYTYNGKKYVRVRVNSCFDGIGFTLSNYRNGMNWYKDGDYVWIEVQPIKWLVDEEKDIAITDKILLAGIQFDNTECFNSNFENTNLKWYLDTYVSKEIIALSQENQMIETHVSNNQLHAPNNKKLKKYTL